MASYRVEVSATAERQLRRLPKRDLGRIVDAIQHLGDDPHPPGSRKLSGYDDTYRIRCGVYRILYVIERKRVTIVVLKIGHRKDVYRQS